MSRRSIRFRITALAAVALAVVLTACAVVIVVVVQRELEHNLDASLARSADDVLAVLSEDDSALPNSSPEDRFAQILDGNGQVLVATNNLAGRDAVVPVPAGDQSASTHADIPIEDDNYRVLIRRFTVDGDVRWVVVGQNIDDAQDAMRSLITVLAVSIPTAVLVLAVIVWWLVGRTLRPVERIRREVASVGLADLDRRVAVPGTGDEIDRLAVTMNDMLARLEASADRERRFVSDASHELRSPLTRMRTTLEVDLALPDGDLAAACQHALGDVVEMQQLVDDLLFLARRDHGEAPVAEELIDLDVVVDDAARGMPQDDVPIDTSAVSAAPVRGSRTQLARMVGNLLTNARRHAVEQVRVQLVESDGEVVLTVDDDGTGVAPADRERVFERFVRLDEARSTHDGGSGLGLAIAREIVVAHGGAIEMGTSPLGGARVTVHLPGSR